MLEELVVLFKGKYQITDEDIDYALSKLRIDEDEIGTALLALSKGQCLLIKDGIEQFGHIGYYGRKSLASAIAKKINETL